MSAENQKKGLLQDLDWSGEMGEKWNLYRDQFEGMIAPIGAATLNLAGFAAGERVVDIGCGAGPTTLEIGRLVQPQGMVLGLDLSPVLVATSRSRAEQASLSNVSFQCGDAATVTLEDGNFDVMFSRFGVMFFADSEAAFRNLHGMLKPGARLVFSCWGPPAENPWAGKLAEIVGRHVGMPPPNPTAPGPFAFADQARTTGILEQAGFSQVNFTPWRGGQLIGGPGMSAEAAADFSLRSFSAAQLLAGKSEAVQQQVLDEVRALYAQHQTDAGIEMPAMAWLVEAKA